MWKTLGPSTSLQMTQHHSFSWLSIFQCVCVCVCVVVVQCTYSRISNCTFWSLAPGSPQLALPLPCASFGCWAIHLQTHSSVPHTRWLFILRWELQTPGLLCSEDVLSDYKQTATTRKGDRKGKKGSTIVCWHWQLPSQHRYTKTRPEEQWLCQQEQGAYGNSASL